MLCLEYTHQSVVKSQVGWLAEYFHVILTSVSKEEKDREGGLNVHIF